MNADPTMSTPAPTPETDAAETLQKIRNQGIPANDWPWKAISSGYDFARQLERERDEARAQVRAQHEASHLMARPWIGVDLDGTLAHYDEWRGIEHIGPPIEAMRLRVMQWLAEGQEVRILTARVGPQRHDVPHTITEITRHIEDWCLTHLGQKLRVTSQKDYCMVEFWDDRCVQVVPNTGRSLAEDMEAARREAHSLAVSLHRQHFAAVGHWEPLKDAAGLITQIDNMCAGLRSMKDNAVWAANQAQNDVAELNQRLIERQESFQAQLIRIEDGWREKLRESQAQILALREAHDAAKAFLEASVADPDITGEMAHHYAVYQEKSAALATPPLPVVPMEDVTPLLDALKIIAANPGASHGPSCIFDSGPIARGAVAKFNTQQPHMKANYQ